MLQRTARRRVIPHPLSCRPCSFSLWSHSPIKSIGRETYIVIKKTLPSPKLPGIVNNEDVKRRVMKINAPEMVSARKNIHPVVTKVNVSSICSNSFALGNNSPSATALFYLRLWPPKMRGMNNMALKAPHAINVQLAPCQKPLTKYITNVLRTTFAFETLLPPMGM